MDAAFRKSPFSGEDPSFVPFVYLPDLGKVRKNQGFFLSEPLLSNPHLAPKVGSIEPPCSARTLSTTDKGSIEPFALNPRLSRLPF